VVYTKIFLFSGASCASSPTSEHLCECLPYDADDCWYLGPIWGLDADRYVSAWEE
jgi:hypothetical protein